MTVRSATMTTGMPRARRARSLALLAALGLGVLTLAGCDDEGGSDATGESQGPTADTDGDGDIDADDADGEAQSAEPVPPPTEPADIELAAGERSASADGGTISIDGPGGAFVTPTGNIACVVTGSSATCQVLDKTYTPPGDQLVGSLIGSCSAGDADAMILTDEQGAWTCPAEPLAPAAALTASGWWETEVDGDSVEVDGVRSAVLAYGQTLAVGATSCTSSEEGVTCRNSDISREFFISRTSYRYG